MAAVVHFTVLRDAITRELCAAIDAGHCDATEALMLFEDVLQGVEDGTEARFPGAGLTNLAEKLLRMAQARRL